MESKQGWGGENRQNQLYKPFLKGALLTVLTVGCTLGAINLAVMAFSTDLSAVWGPLIQSHAYAQIFGWVGLFVMGIAYHIIPRFFLRPLRHPGLVTPSLVLVASGIILRFFSQPLAQYPLPLWITVLSATLGLCGVTLFVWAMYDTMRSGSDKFGSPAYVVYIGAGLAWFWLVSVATIGITIYLALNQLDTIPLSWDAPYLRGTLNGALVTLILGFTLRTVPQIMATHVPSSRPLRTIFGVYTLAVIVQVVCDSDLLLNAYREQSLLRTLGAGLELTALMAFAIVLKLFSIKGISMQKHKKNPWPERFVRTAYCWLIFAALLNLAYALSVILGASVPHAFVASYHHALTVGFFSMMIIGMSMRLVPGFITLMNKQARIAGIIFALLLVGSTLRVTCESLAYLYGGAFYAVMGLSGFIEVSALGLYAVMLWKAMGLASYGPGSPNGKKIERFIPLQKAQPAEPVQEFIVYPRNWTTERSDLR